MTLLLTAAAGAAFQEAMYWYGKRYEILANGLGDGEKGWVPYLLIVAFMIIASSIGTVIWFEGREESVPLRDALLLGASFPAIFKLAVKGYTSTDAGPNLGQDVPLKKALKAYF